MAHEHQVGEIYHWVVRLEVVPDSVADAVRETLALDGWNPDTDEPMVVEDGWMT